MAKPPTAAGKPLAPAKAKPRASTKAKPAKPKRQTSLLGPFIFTTILVLLAVTAMPICILLIAGMIPTITAYAVDQTERRMLTLTVGALNLAGVVPFCMQLWFSADPMQGLTQLITQPWVWMVMYMAAGIGWLLHFGMPVAVAIVLEQSLDVRKSKYVSIQKRLKEEWGDDVALVTVPEE
ncbi:MAG TPA: hypothetical protein VM689_01915 [Aliidongia sp.]|nr:hypothetical protein [Aliidongia sp.]